MQAVPNSNAGNGSQTFTIGLRAFSKKSGARDRASGEDRESDTEPHRVWGRILCLAAQSSSERAKQHPHDHVRALNTEAHRPAAGVHWRWS